METLNDIGGFWHNLYPAEQVRLINLLVEKIVITQSEIAMEVKTDGFKSLIKEIINDQN